MTVPGEAPPDKIFAEIEASRMRAERILAQLNPPIPLGEDVISKTFLLGRDVIRLADRLAVAEREWRHWHGVATSLRGRMAWGVHSYGSAREPNRSQRFGDTKK